MTLMHGKCALHKLDSSIDTPLFPIVFIEALILIFLSLQPLKRLPINNLLSILNPKNKGTLTHIWLPKSKLSLVHSSLLLCLLFLNPANQGAFMSYKIILSLTTKLPCSIIHQLILLLIWMTFPVPEEHSTLPYFLLVSCHLDHRSQREMFLKHTTLFPFIPHNGQALLFGYLTPNSTSTLVHVLGFHPQLEHMDISQMQDLIFSDCKVLAQCHVELMTISFLHPERVP